MAMREKITKCSNLTCAPDRLDRLGILLAIRLNHLLFKHEPAERLTVTFAQFLTQLAFTHSALSQMMKPDGEAVQAVERIRAIFKSRGGDTRTLPFPEFYNADQSLALLSYGLTRYLKPDFAVETGVGYGITSALVLLALANNDHGHLASIDLPPLSDPYGLCTGLAIPEELKTRWRLQLGSSGRCLPSVVRNARTIGLFISDSANVYTLQRREFEVVYPKLMSGGAALFNNTGSKFQKFLHATEGLDVHTIWQVDKPRSATTLILKN